MIRRANFTISMSWMRRCGTPSDISVHDMFGTGNRGLEDSGHIVRGFRVKQVRDGGGALRDPCEEVGFGDHAWLAMFKERMVDFVHRAETCTPFGSASLTAAILRRRAAPPAFVRSAEN